MVELDDTASLVQHGMLKLSECRGAIGEIKLDADNADIATCKSTPPPKVL